MSVDDFREQKYNEVFEETMARLRERRAQGSLTLAETESLLQTLYLNEGNDWDGKGALFHLTISAEIAAHELVIAEWRKEESGATGSEEE